MRRLLQQYGAEIGSLRLIARGVSPAAARPIDLEDIEVSTAQQRAAQILTFIPMFIIMAGFVGGMQIATDSTAGERERGSLEPLLVNPAPRLVFVGGKWLAAALTAMASTALTTMLCANLPRFLPLEEMGIRFRIGPEHMTGIIAAALPMCLFSAALQSAVATLARSFKEAQSYMGVLVLLPMIPGVMGALYPIGNAPWMYATPDAGAIRVVDQRARRADTVDQRVPDVGRHLPRRRGHPGSDYLDPLRKREDHLCPIKLCNQLSRPKSAGFSRRARTATTRPRRARAAANRTIWPRSRAASSA